MRTGRLSGFARLHADQHALRPVDILFGWHCLDCDAWGRSAGSGAHCWACDSTNLEMDRVIPEPGSTGHRMRWDRG